jgi:hypothetical protein
MFVFAVKTIAKKKKDLTLREDLKSIQPDGGKARWAELPPEERSAQARKIVQARRAKEVAESPVSTGFGQQVGEGHGKEIATKAIVSVPTDCNLWDSKLRLREMFAPPQVKWPPRRDWPSN